MTEKFHLKIPHGLNFPVLRQQLLLVATIRLMGK